MTRNIIERNDNLNNKTTCRNVRESAYSAPTFKASDEAVCDMADISFRKVRRAPSAAAFVLPLIAAMTSFSGLLVK